MVVQDSFITRFPGARSAIHFFNNQMAKVLTCGPIPKHIAIIMDGNRRFAKAHNRETSDGHNAGFETLTNILGMCYSVGVKEVTVFAFSIENFNRSQREVDALMEIAKSRLTQIMDNGELAEEYGVCIKVLGDVKRLPEDVRKVVEKVTESTKHNNKAVLNICCPYTSRDDIVHSMQNSIYEVSKGAKALDNITEETITSNMYTGDAPPLDILIRTSGVHRFSDFMLWETTSKTQIDFVNVYWPDFTRWHLFWILIKWSCNQQWMGDATAKED